MKKIFDDRNLLTLVLIVIVCSVCKLFGSKLNIVIYFFLLLHFKVIIKAKDDEILPIILFNHTCSALYDSIGFTYLFNFTIFIFVLKLFFKKKSVPKKSSLLLVILFLYNALIMIYGNFFSMSIIMSTFSLFISYVFIIFISNNCGIIDYEKCYEFFFVGFVISALCSFVVPFRRWGFKIPKAYRFTGYLRDPNYFSVDALLLMNMSMVLYKKFNIKYFIIFFISIFSVSKMFLLLSFSSFVVYLFISFFNRNKKAFLITILIILLLPVFLLSITKTNYYSVIIDKYIYRSEVSELFTGRDYLQTYYINKLKNSPRILFFGSSLNYRYLLNAGTGNYAKYKNFGAHNTYLDILLSWGILGSFIYICLLFQIRNNLTIYNDNKNVKFVNSKGEYFVFFITILISLFALSYLNIDFFAILILILMLFSPKVMSFINCNN